MTREDSIAQSEPTSVAYTLKAARKAGPGVATPLSEAECDRREHASSGLTWVNVCVRDREAGARLLQERFGFHDLEIEDALTAGERPHLHEDEDHLFLTAPAVRVEGGKLWFDEVGIFAAPGYVVTVSAAPVSVVERTFERWASRRGLADETSAQLLHAILDAIVDDYYPAIDILEDCAESLEGDVFKGKPVAVKDILRLKRRLLELRRRLSPLRDILNGLLRHDLALVPLETKPYFQDVFDHTLRILETIDLNRDILASVVDAHLANVSNRLNEVMRVLTVIATILMTLGIVTGWYGMNFKHMPELEWPWAYPAVMVLGFAIIGVEVWLFRRKGWL